MARAADEAYEALRESILGGALQSGERLGEVELALQLGVSRTPVREALRRLAAEGLVELSPHRWSRVAEWSEDELDELFRLRALLEGYGAMLASQRIDQATLPILDRLCEQMESCAAGGTPRDFDRIAELNSQFHSTILEAAASPRLTTVLAAVIHVPLVIRAFRRYSPEALTRSMGHHRDLVAALTAGYGTWAASLMRSHVLAARHALLADRAASGAKSSTS